MNNNTHSLVTLLLIFTITGKAQEHQSFSVGPSKTQQTIEQKPALANQQFFALDTRGQYAFGTDQQGHLHVFDLETTKKCAPISSPVASFVGKDQIGYADRQSGRFIIKEYKNGGCYAVSMRNNKLEFALRQPKQKNPLIPYKIAGIENDPAKALLSFWDENRKKKNVHLVDLEKIRSFKPIRIKKSAIINRPYHFFLHNRLISIHRNKIRLQEENKNTIKLKNHSPITALACDSERNLLYSIDQKGTIKSWLIGQELYDKKAHTSLKTGVPLSAIALHPYYPAVSVTSSAATGKEKKGVLFFHDLLENRLLFEQPLIDPITHEPSNARKLVWPNDETIIAHLETGRIATISIAKRHIFDKLATK